MIRILCPKEDINVTADNLQECLIDGDLTHVDEEEHQLYLSGAIYLYRHFLKRPHMRPFFERFNHRFKSEEFLAKQSILKDGGFNTDIITCLYHLAPLVISNSSVLEDEKYLLDIRNTFTHLALSDISMSKTDRTNHHPITNTDPIQCHKMKKELDKLSPYLAYKQKRLNNHYRDSVKKEGLKDVNEARHLGIVLEGFVEYDEVGKETVQFFLDLDGATPEEIRQSIRVTQQEVNDYTSVSVPYDLQPINPTYHGLMISHSSIAAYLTMLTICIGNDPNIKCTFIVGTSFLYDLNNEQINTKGHILRIHDRLTGGVPDEDANLIEQISHDASFIKHNAIDSLKDYMATERLRLSGINNINPNQKDIQYMAEKILTMDVVPPNLLEKPHYGFEWQRRIHTLHEKRIRNTKSDIHNFFTAQLSTHLHDLFSFRQNDLEILYANAKPEHISYIRESLLSIFCNASLNGHPRDIQALRALFDSLYQSFAGELLNFHLFNMHILHDYLNDKRKTLLKGNHYELEARRIESEYHKIEKQLAEMKDTFKKETDLAIKRAVKPYEKTIQKLTKQQETNDKLLLEKDVRIRKLEMALREAKDALKTTPIQENGETAEHDTIMNQVQPVIYYTPNQVPYTDDDIENLNERLNQESTLIYGGHDKWVQRMREYFPKATVRNPDLLNTDMESLVKKHTTIIVNIHVMNHSGSGRIKDAVKRLKSSGVTRDLLFIDTKSIQRDNLLIAILDASKTQTDW